MGDSVDIEALVQVWIFLHIQIKKLTLLNSYQSNNYLKYKYFRVKSNQHLPPLITWGPLFWTPQMDTIKHMSLISIVKSVEVSNCFHLFFSISRIFFFTSTFWNGCSWLINKFFQNWKRNYPSRFYSLSELNRSFVFPNVVTGPEIPGTKKEETGKQEVNLGYTRSVLIF